MIVTGKGKGGPDHDSPLPSRFDETLRILGRIVTRACSGDLRAFTQLTEIVRAAEAAHGFRLTEAEREIIDRLDAEAARAKMDPGEIAAEAAWPEDVLLALVSLGDLPSLFLTKPPADDRQEGRTE